MTRLSLSLSDGRRPPAWRRGLAELGLLLAVGAFMGTIGPYGTDALPGGHVYVYWIAAIVGGGMIGIALDETVGRLAGGFWPRLAVSSVLMTPAVTLLVMMLGHWLANQPVSPSRYLNLLWQVLVISAPVMALRALAWRRPRTVVETRTIVAPPLPEAEAAFRRRLSARRRSARLIAVEAHDHYLRVHTDAGPELVTLRFADALAELAGAHGFRTHRSWWVAADAIEAVRWRRGVGEARLAGGLAAPISRTHAPSLKEAGW
jgi:DNA-binding LytR/AlgR family response regulator